MMGKEEKGNQLQSPSLYLTIDDLDAVLVAEEEHTEEEQEEAEAAGTTASSPA